MTAPPGEWFGVGGGWLVYAAALSRRVAVGGWLGGTLDRAGSDALLDRLNAHIIEHGQLHRLALHTSSLVDLVKVQTHALRIGPPLTGFSP